MISLLDLDPAAYASHQLHSEERAFPETNCYTDLWIEIVHARGLDPVAMLAFCLIVDFEGDQWTFFKPPPADLETLYGMEIQELQVYRPVPDHVAEQLRLGRLVTIEVDGHHLPDTSGRSYHLTHEKTAIAVEAIDAEHETLRYFHNRGYFVLAGADYRAALRCDPGPLPDLPPYIEFIRLDRLAACPSDELRPTAAALLERQLLRRPATNPVLRFGERLAIDLPALGSDDSYHSYAFATLRQCGAAWGAAATFLRWLDPGAHAQAAECFTSLESSAKLVLFKLARAAMTGRSFDPSDTIVTMARAWDLAFDALQP